MLTTANAAHDVRPGIDFFPLTVDVEERAYAAGKIPGSFFRREGRPTEDAILTCRLTDRPLRPSFADGFRNETQVVTTVIGADQENPHDVLSINAASAALMISGIPFDGPDRRRAHRLHRPTASGSRTRPTQEGDAGTFELVVAGRELDDGDVAIMMVEAGGTEKSFDYYADGAPQGRRGGPRRRPRGLQGVDQGVDRPAAPARRQRHRHPRADRPLLEFTPVLDYGDDVFAAVERVATDELATAVTISAKAERNAAIDAAADEAIAELCGTDRRAGRVRRPRAGDPRGRSAR